MVMCGNDNKQYIILIAAANVLFFCKLPKPCFTLTRVSKKNRYLLFVTSLCRNTGTHPPVLTELNAPLTVETGYSNKTTKYNECTVYSNFLYGWNNTPTKL